MRRLARRFSAALLATASLAPAAGAAAQLPVPQPSATPTPAREAASPQELLQRLELAWRTHDLEAYLALWDFSTVEAYTEERGYAEEAFAGDETQLRLQEPAQPGPRVAGLTVSLDVFVIKEPRGRVDQWLLSLVRRRGGWRIVAKQPVGQLDGLVHLSLDPQGYRAEGLTLRFEDFELRMQRGSLFLSPHELGPTLLVFVGEAVVHFRPRLEEEREQLRQFCGKPELVERVKTALARVHPADLYRVLEPVQLRPDPQAASRFGAAQRMFRDEGGKAFLLDAATPRSPWWLLPAVGDSAIVFETKRGMLTFTVSDSEPEGLSLFDRAKRRQICLYPRAGRSTRYSEDGQRTADILEHDLRVRVDPPRAMLWGEDTLRVELLATTSTLRLKLDDALSVESVTSAQAGRHLFFRVRNQDSLMVSLGALAGTLGEVQLTVRYSGVLRPGTIESEVVQLGPDPSSGRIAAEEVPIESVLVYTNRNAWYPQGTTDDYAAARIRFEVPAGYTAVTGGERRSARVEGERTLVEYVVDQPGRYITAAIGRFYDMGTSQEGGTPVHTFAVSRLRNEAADSAKRAGEVLRFYTEQFGPNPYPQLNLVLIEGYTPGGHSPPGMVLLQSRPVLLRTSLRDDPANFTDVPGFFLAHELAHQWWGHGVAGQNYRERWISEGMAQHAAASWVRATHGEDEFQSVLRQFSRWAVRYTALGPIHLGYRLGHIKGDPQIFRALVYDKAAYVLHMLSGIVGEAAFREALQSLQTDHVFTKIGSDDVREALEKASGRELEPYFRAWIFGTRLPSLRWSARSESTLTQVSVAVEELPGPVPLTITLSDQAGRRDERVILPPSGGSWSFPADGRARAEINADSGLLASVKKR